MSSALRNPWNVLPALGVLLIALYPIFSDDLYYQNMIMLSMVFAIGAVGLNIITGYAGYVSLGQGAFLGLGRLHRRDPGHRRGRQPLPVGAGRRPASPEGSPRCWAWWPCGRAAPRS